MRRPRIVFVGHVARLSGGEIALLRLVEALGDRIEAVVVLAENGPLVAGLRAAGARVVVLELDAGVRDARRNRAVRTVGAAGAVTMVGYVLRLRRLLRELAPDVVHTNTLKAALYGGVAGRLARVPVVWHIRDRISPDYLPASTVRLVHLAARVLPTAVVANSATTLATLPGRAGTVVPHIVGDMAATAASPASSRLTIGVAGRLSPWKGQDLFLRAFADAFADSDARAVLIGAAMFGEDEYARWLRVLAATLGIAKRTEFRGFRADMASEYARLDLLVHCSTVPEPYGQVVVEGMSAGLCVLAADEGGPRELIEDGVDGVLVPPRSVVALADAMRRWADDAAGRRRLGRAARASSARLAGAGAGEQLLALYGRLARATVAAE